MISEYMKQSMANGSVIREMFEAGARMRKELGDANVFDFSLGNPDLKPPAVMLKTATDRLNSSIHGYMDNAGYPDVREKIATDYNRRYGTDACGKHIVMTVGAAGALNVVLKTLLNPGDEVLCFTPYFGEYHFYAENHGGVLKPVATDEDFLPDTEALRRAVNPRTRAVIINTPNNPTGVVYPEEILRDLSDTLREESRRIGHPIYLISDEPYREILYDGKSHHSLLRFYDDALICYSYSKSASLPGERIGYVLAGPRADGVEEVVAAMKTANRILGFVNAPSLFQTVIGEHPDACSDLETYARNRAVLTDLLSRQGWDYITPQGAFYLFLKSPVPDEKAFCKRAAESGLLIVPSSAFGVSGYARIAYCVSEDMIRRSEAAFSELKRFYDTK